MNLDYGLVLSPSVDANETRFVNETVDYVISCDLSEMTDELKERVDALFQDLLMLYHLSAEHSIVQYMSSVDNLVRKFEESGLSASSPKVAYYLGKLEGLRSLYHLGQQQCIMNKYTSRDELMDLFVRMIATGDSDLDSLLKLITEKDTEVLHRFKLINVKTGVHGKVSLSRRGRYCLIKRLQDFQGRTLKMYAVVQSIPDAVKPKSVQPGIVNSINFYFSKKSFGGVNEYYNRRTGTPSLEFKGSAGERR